MNKYIVLVDIDGTISKVGDRLRYLSQKPKDWDSFYEACDEDEPIDEVIRLVNNLAQNRANYQIVFCTGRRESVRNKTLKWMSKYYIGGQDPILLMRKNGDKRHDTISKPELIKESDIKLSDIAFVLEDRNSMVTKWRELGLICLQVADGDF